MTFDQLIPVALFVIAMVGTPGPNNLMLLTAGANFGFRRSLPHILGITMGCQVLLLAIALGLGQMFSAWPLSIVLLKLGGGGFLVWMAVQLLRPRAAALGEGWGALAAARLIPTNSAASDVVIAFRVSPNISSSLIPRARVSEYEFVSCSMSLNTESQP